MNYAQIRDMDIVNGEGIAVSLFVSGCKHRCVNCFNKEAWNFNYGQPWTQEVEDKFIELCQRDYVDCISILGGDLLCQKYEEIVPLLHRLHMVGKPIYVWTGYTLEELKYDDIYVPLCEYVDYLIDGKFEKDKTDIRLRLRGSSNQRIWDLRSDIPIDVTEEKGWRK